jgi:hypothetical protein
MRLQHRCNETSEFDRVFMGIGRTLPDIFGVVVGHPTLLIRPPRAPDHTHPSFYSAILTVKMIGKKNDARARYFGGQRKETLHEPFSNSYSNIKPDRLLNWKCRVKETRQKDRKRLLPARGAH